jgi:hypothetical protein
MQNNSDLFFHRLRTIAPEKGRAESTRSPKREKYPIWATRLSGSLTNFYLSAIETAHDPVIPWGGEKEASAPVRAKFGSGEPSPCYLNNGSSPP